MNNIIIYTASVLDAEGMVRDILEAGFGINHADSEFFYLKYIKEHFDGLKEDCWLVGEFPYVDKVYRDSYYHYYSSKHAKYLRDCARISIFENEVQAENFRNKGKKDDLQKRYRGFIVLRPAEPFFIGRSVISPMAVKKDNFSVCTAEMNATVNGMKFTVKGFPHSSQDTETMTCAETTLWSMMEYFSSRYAEYKPVLPSKIIDTVKEISYERQIPSKGLDILQISYALKRFGFATTIYSEKDGEDGIEKIISVYVESGIPVITAVNNHDPDEKKNNNEEGKISHAMICVGHENINPGVFENLPEKQIKDNRANEKLLAAIKRKRNRLYDYDDLEKKFVFIDDNRPAYVMAPLKEPCYDYGSEEWRKCKPKYLIVPLYKRIYLEAYQGKKFLLNFLLIGPYPIKDDQELLIRFFLTSNRSFKDKLGVNDSFSPDVKEKIMAKPLPKFIWVGELSTRALMKEGKANGLVILDATEPNIQYLKPLVLAAYGGNVIEPDEEQGELKRKPIPLDEFLIYENNLTCNKPKTI